MGSFLVKKMFFVSLFARLIIMCKFGIVYCENFHKRDSENEFEIFILIDCNSYRHTSNRVLFYGRQFRNLFTELKISAILLNRCRSGFFETQQLCCCDFPFLGEIWRQHNDS